MRITSLALASLLLATSCTPGSSPGLGATHATAAPSATGPALSVASAPAQPASASASQPTGSAAAFVASQTEAVRPLEIAANKAWFEASITGTEAAFAKSQQAENAMLRFYSDPARFAQVKSLLADKNVADPLLRRQLEVLYLAMLGKQVEPALLERITKLGSEIERAFNTYRGKVGGRELSQNATNQILRESKDSAELKTAWEAQKGVGPLVAPKLAELVELRNEVAHKLGFRDFYALRIAEHEQEEGKLLALFDEVDRLTRASFVAAKADVDRRLSQRLGVPVAKLMPWHYQNAFFQDPPAVFKTGLEEIYEKQDTLALVRRYYDGMGLDTGDILARSDLYEKEGKSPHAFSSDIDRAGDVRILANVEPGFEWQATMLHEMGHSVYSKQVDPSLPWLLRKEAHPLTTEAVAMMVERQASSPYWAKDMGLMDAAARDQALAEARASLAFASLQFSRWALVMLHFERELYRDPKQNLNKLWWDLVEKYQGLRRPAGRDAPDYASKIHLVVAPVYYHNYLLGDLLSAQLHESLAALAGKPPLEATYVGDARVGEMLRTKVFRPGARYRWDDLVVHATGKPLSAEAFARRFTK